MPEKVELTTNSPKTTVQAIDGITLALRDLVEFNKQLLETHQAIEDKLSDLIRTIALKG